MCRASGARGDLYITDPLLTEWANFCRTSGADARKSRGLRHVSRLRRLGNLYIADPLLAEWANFCRTSGAESGNRAVPVKGQAKVKGDKGAIWHTRRPSRCVRGKERSLDCAPFVSQDRRDDGGGWRDERRRRKATAPAGGQRYEGEGGSQVYGCGFEDPRYRGRERKATTPAGGPSCLRTSQRYGGEGRRQVDSWFSKFGVRDWCGRDTRTVPRSRGLRALGWRARALKCRHRRRCRRARLEIRRSFPGRV